MLISKEEVIEILSKNNIVVKGVLHVGAHLCEESDFYYSTKYLELTTNKVVWVDANPKLIEINIAKGISNCYVAALDETEKECTFKITNNGQSSSLLDFGLHQQFYPHITVTETVSVITEKLSSFFIRTKLCPQNYNFWNFDIQGSELAVFKGSPELLKYVDVIYTEVNTAEVYKDCGLLSQIDCILEENGLIRVKLEMTDNNWGDAIYVRKLST